MKKTQSFYLKGLNMQEVENVKETILKYRSASSFRKPNNILNYNKF